MCLSPWQGRGVLLLSNFEAPAFLRQLREVDIKSAPPAPPAAAASIAPAVQQALQVSWSLSPDV